MSGSEFQANGAAFGDGIYLSGKSVALNFAPRFAVTKRLSRLWGESGGDTHNRMFAEAAKAWMDSSLCLSAKSLTIRRCMQETETPRSQAIRPVLPEIPEDSKKWCADEYVSRERSA